MAFAHGRNAVFAIDDSGGNLRTISQYVDNVSGLPGGRGLNSVTAFGDQGEKSIPGLVNVQFTVSGHFDSTATTGPNAVLSGLRTTNATSTFEYGPEGGAPGKVMFTGECWLTEYTVDASVAEKVSFSASFQVDGVVTTDAYS